MIPNIKHPKTFHHKGTDYLLISFFRLTDQEAQKILLLHLRQNKPKKKKQNKNDKKNQKEVIEKAKPKVVEILTHLDRDMVNLL
jgi:hypothetical protein